MISSIKLTIIAIALSCLTAGIAHGFQDNFESYGSPGDAFPTAEAKLKGWHATFTGEGKTKISGTGGAAPSNIAGSPFGEASSYCVYTHKPTDQSATLNNYFADNSTLGVTGSLGYNLTGSGIEIKWDGYFTHSHNPTWRIYDSAGIVAIEVMMRFNRQIRINGVDMGEVLAGAVSGTYYWMQFQVTNINVDTNTFDFSLLNWIDDQTPPVSLYSQTGVSFKTGVTDLARWFSFNNAAAAAMTYTDNFEVVPPARIAASDPVPARGSANVSVANSVLSWTGYAGSTAQRVYFGKTAELDAPADYKGEQTAETFALGDLDFNTTYYWRIDLVYSGDVYVGDVWSFTTHGDLMAYDGFGYAAGQLGSTSDGGFGWAGTWQRSLGDWCYITISSSSIALDFFYSNDYTGNKADFDNSAPAGNNDAKRQLTVPIDLDSEQTYYLSYIASADNDQANQIDFELFETKTSDAWMSAGMLYEGYPNITSPAFRLRDKDGNWIQNVFGSWQSGKANLVVLKIVASNTGNDMVYASVYNAAAPVPETEPAVWDASFSYNGTGLLRWIGFEGRAGLEYGNYQIDEIRYGLSWLVTAGEAEIEHPRIIAYEGFEYTPFLNLSQGGNGNGGIGWADDWERVEGGWCYVTVGQGSLNPGMDYLLGAKGNKVEHIAGGVNNGGMRKLEYPIDTRIDRDYYISYLAMGESNTYNQVTLGLYEEKAGNFLFRTHMFYQGFPSVPTPKFALRDNLNIWTTRQFGSWVSGEVYLYVIKISATAAGNDTVSVSVFSASNPLPIEEPAVWDASFTAQTNTKYPWIEISGRADQYATWNLDEIYIGTGWGAVTGWASACGDFGTIMPYDLNQDCQVNMIDFALIGDNWLDCTDPLGADCGWAIEQGDPNFAGLFTSLDAAETNVYQTSGVTVDGDLSDWEGSRWYKARFTGGYNSENATDITDADISLKWNPAAPDKVYLAVRVTDTNQSFAAVPADWNSGDNIEVRFTVNSTSTDTAWNDSLFDTAQRYCVFPLSAGGTLANLGSLATARDAGEYTDAQYAVSVAGNMIQYEMAIPAYLTYNVGTKSGTKATLGNGDVIAFNIQFNSVNGELSGALFNNQSFSPEDWAKFTITANSSLVLGDFGFLKTDLDKNGYVGLSDIDVIIDRWLSCTDPEIPGCDQPWLP